MPRLGDTGNMRRAFAHEAVLEFAQDADSQAPGAAVTVALCGHWQHEPPCPLAPHHNQATRVGNDLIVRTLFAVEPDLEDAVRQRIDAALRAGQLSGPDGVITRWHLRSTHPSAIASQEADHAQRLVASS